MGTGPAKAVLHSILTDPVELFPGRQRKRRFAVFLGCVAEPKRQIITHRLSMSNEDTVCVTARRGSSAKSSICARRPAMAVGKLLLQTCDRPPC